MTSPCAEIARARPLLGTLVELRAIAATASVAHAAIDRGFEAIAQVQRLMAYHDAGSDLSRLHAEAWRDPVRVHPWTWRVLRFSAQLAVATDGLFDPTTAAMLVRSGRLPPPPCRVPAPVEGASWRDIVLLSEGRVAFRRPLLIDLGGIAKGFAIDRALTAMRRGGALGVSVDAGGDLRIRSPEPRCVAVRDPAAQPRVVRPLADVWDGAVATSAAYPGEAGAAAWSGIVDPATGEAADTAVSVTVFAPSALRADALTKVVALAPEAHIALIERLGAEAIILDAAGGARRLVGSATGWCLLTGNVA